MGDCTGLGFVQQQEPCTVRGASLHLYNHNAVCHTSIPAPSTPRATPCPCPLPPRPPTRIALDMVWYALSWRNVSSANTLSASSLRSSRWASV